ncbi:MAG: ribonuclease III [bacterium]
MKDIQNLQKTIGIQFNNETLLQQAFVHRSYLNENSSFELESNERLEFLGDAVLELVVTENLYNNFSNPEGELTNWRAALVKGVKLAEIAQDLNFDKYLLLSKGEAQGSQRARQNILADCFEAFIGALYLDQGYEGAKKFILENLVPDLSKILKEKTYRDAKSQFQEAIQDKFSITPEYRVLEETGPDHAKHFVVGAYVNSELYGTGEGNSKQEAQQEAASEGLKNLK